MRINKRLFKILFINIGLMVFIFSSLIWIVFTFILPVITRHGQNITVPNLKGIHIDEIKDILVYRHLRYKLTEDVLYLPSYPSSVVLEQYPKAGSRVKERRTIYITLNAEQPPEVIMPNLVDGSVRNAHIILKSRGLGYNNITYITDIAKNAVLEQRYKGYVIAPGTRIPQGTKIDLVVGAGLEKKPVIVPDVVDMKAEEAELLLLDTGLSVSDIHYEHIDSLQAGTVFRQQPKMGMQVRLGQGINLWVVEANPEANDSIPESDEPIIEADHDMDATIIIDKQVSPRDTGDIVMSETDVDSSNR